jgi:hypothetical protein
MSLKTQFALMFQMIPMFLMNHVFPMYRNYRTYPNYPMFRMYR